MAQDKAILAEKKIQKILNLQENSKAYYQTYRKQWTKDYKQYRSWLDADTTKEYLKWRSRLFIPATARAVDGLLPDLMLALFGPNPFFNVFPRAKDDVGQAKLMEVLLSYQFDEADFFNQFFIFSLQAAIYGTSIGKTYWKTDVKTKKITRKEEIDGVELDKEVVEETEYEIFNGPVFEPIDIFDIYVSPSATSLKDTWVIHRSEKTLGEIKNLAELGIYNNVEELEALIMSEVDKEGSDRRWAAGLTRYGQEEGDRRKIEILEYWNEDRTRTCTIGGGKVYLKPMQDSPFWMDNGVPYDPFVRLTMWDLPFEFYGVGISSKVADLQSQLNLEVNQRLDNRNLRQNLIIKVKRGAGVNVRRLQTSPGAIWMADELDAIQTENIPDIASSYSFTEENLLKQEIEEITGVTKYVTGSGTDTGRRTATEVNTLSQMSSKGFALIVKRIEEQAMKPIIRNFYQLDQMFMDEEKIVRIAGPEYQFVRVPPPEVAQNYDFIPAASSQLINKDMRVQQMIQLFGMSENPIVKENLRKKIWESWGYKDYEELVLPPAGMGMGQGLPGMPPTNTTGGMPVAPTGMRIPSPQEGMMALPMGGGGERPI